MDTSKELLKVDWLVRKFLRDDPDTRNCDKLLTVKIFQVFLRQSGNQLTINLDQLAGLPSFETVKRLRAKVQNVEKLYPPTDQSIFKRRRMKQEDFREIFAFMH